VIGWQLQAITLIGWNLQPKVQPITQDAPADHTDRRLVLTSRSQ
jgi:hypothetical protein